MYICKLSICILNILLVSVWEFQRDPKIFQGCFNLNQNLKLLVSVEIPTESNQFGLSPNIVNNNNKNLCILSSP
jgi:hypothetical protein